MCLGARGRAGVRSGAHFRLLQRHLRPRDRSLRTRDHLQVRIIITLDVSGNLIRRIGRLVYFCLQLRISHLTIPYHGCEIGFLFTVFS
jgi:hypothetical protein